MAKCHNCSARIMPGQRVCRACGEPFPGSPEDPDAPDPMIGRTVAGNFEVLELIGEGAMGRVYLSRQVSLDKKVAIKVLHRHLANDPKLVRRFHREARAASRLSHPNSLQITDFGEDRDGTLYIAMEYLDGDDLLTVIEHDAPFRPRRILNLMKQVLTALDAAHHAGIIHRDLKPENVVVLEEPSGREHVKVCDFGIAKIQEAEGGSAITVTGFVCGTPEYMAPEQARGEKLDNRADLYAAGCMLYQMLTTELPFTADSALGIITKHLTEEPMAPSVRKPEWGIPEALERVALKAMAKERDDRYADAAEMLHALEAAVEEMGDDADTRLSEGVREPTSKVSTTAVMAEVRPAGHPMAWAGGLIVLGGAAVAVALLGSPEPPQADRQPPSVSSLQGDRGPETPDAGTTAAPPDRADAMVGVVDAGGPDAGPEPPNGRPNDRGPRDRRRPHHGAMDDATMDPAMTAGGDPGREAYEDGRRLFLANDIPGAIRSFEQAARAMPRNPQVHKQLGRAHMRAGNVTRAAAAYRRYLDLAPDAPDREIIERMLERER